MLDSDQEDHLTRLLTGLDEVKTKLNSKSAEFFEQMQERFEEYGSNTRLSAKQLDWLENLYKEHVGPLN
jgi:hypothetical protein